MIILLLSSNSNSTVNACLKGLYQNKATWSKNTVSSIVSKQKKWNYEYDNWEGND